MEDFALALVTAANVLERLKVGLSAVWFGTATTAAAAGWRAGWEEELGLTDLGRFLHFRKIGPEGFLGRAGRSIGFTIIIAHPKFMKFQKTSL